MENAVDAADTEEDTEDIVVLDVIDDEGWCHVMVKGKVVCF